MSSNLKTIQKQRGTLPLFRCLYQLLHPHLLPSPLSLCPLSQRLSTPSLPHPFNTLPNRQTDAASPRPRNPSKTLPPPRRCTSPLPNPLRNPPLKPRILFHETHPQGNVYIEYGPSCHGTA